MTYHFEAIGEGNANINLVADSTKVKDVFGWDLLPFTVGDGTEGHVTVTGDQCNPYVFDTDDDGKIGFSEMVDALMDYLTGGIEYNCMVDTLMLYLIS
jgi:hypothetical protein